MLKNDGVLTLHVESRFFSKLESGEKNVEYRDLSPYWIVRILNPKKHYRKVHFYRGYPSRNTGPLVREIEKIIVNVETDQIEIHLENIM